MAKHAKPIPTINKYKAYVLYAEHCLATAKAAPNKEARLLQRGMATEWLKLAEQLAK